VRFRRNAGHGSMINCVGRFFLKVAGRSALPVLTRCCLSRMSASRNLNQLFWFATALRVSLSSFHFGAYSSASLYLTSYVLD
jgi:hypothetical protein